MSDLKVKRHDNTEDKIRTVSGYEYRRELAYDSVEHQDAQVIIGTTDFVFEKLDKTKTTRIADYFWGPEAKVALSYVNILYNGHPCNYSFKVVSGETVPCIGKGYMVYNETKEKRVFAFGSVRHEIFFAEKTEYETQDNRDVCTPHRTIPYTKYRSCEIINKEEIINPPGIVSAMHQEANEIPEVDNGGISNYSDFSIVSKSGFVFPFVKNQGIFHPKGYVLYSVSEEWRDLDSPWTIELTVYKPDNQFTDILELYNSKMEEDIEYLVSKGYNTEQIPLQVEGGPEHVDTYMHKAGIVGRLPQIENT